MSSRTLTYSGDDSCNPMPVFADIQYMAWPSLGTVDYVKLEPLVLSYIGLPLGRPTCFSSIEYQDFDMRQGPT